MSHIHRSILLAGAAIVVPTTLATSVSADVLRVRAVGTVDRATTYAPDRFSDIAAGDAFAWEYRLDLTDLVDGSPPADGVGYFRNEDPDQPGAAANTSLAWLTLRPDTLDATTTVFDGDASITDGGGDPVFGYLNANVEDRSSGADRFQVGARDDHPTAAGTSLVATFTFEGLPELDGDDPAQLATIGSFDGGSLTLTGQLFAYDHIADRYAWIASLAVDRVTFQTAATVVPLPTAALIGLAGLGGLPLLRRRSMSRGVRTA